MSDFRFISPEQIEAMKNRELYFASIGPDQQQELLGAVISEHRDDAGEWIRYLGGEATHAFIGSIAGSIHAGVNKVRSTRYPEEVFYTHNDLVQDFFAYKNLGSIAAALLSTKLEVSTKIYWQSFSYARRRTNQVGSQHLQFPVGLNRHRIARTFEDAQILDGGLTTEAATSAVEQSGSSKTYLNSPEKYGQILARIIGYEWGDYQEHDQPVLDTADTTESLDAQDEMSLLPWYLLTDRQKEIVELKYGVNGRSSKEVSEIATYMEISRQAVHKQLDIAMNILRNPKQVYETEHRHRFDKFHAQYIIHNSGLEFVLDRPTALPETSSLRNTKHLNLEELIQVHDSLTFAEKAVFYFANGGHGAGYQKKVLIADILDTSEKIVTQVIKIINKKIRKVRQSD